MLDAIEPHNDYLTPQEAIVQGDQLARQAICDPASLAWAIHRYVLAGAGYEWIIRRVLDQSSVTLDVNTGREAAWAVARHCAKMDMPLHRIIARLAHLCAEVPCWPDADEIAAIAEAAVAEFA